MMRTLCVVIFAAVFVMAAFVTNAWLSARRNAAQLAATITSQNKTMQQVVANEHFRATQLATALATIADQRRQVNTARQATAAIPSVLPQLPLPVTISFGEMSPAAHPSVPANSQILAPAEMSIPQADLKPLYQGLQDCRICSLERDATKQDLADEQKKVSVLTNERDAAIAATHGGSLWRKLRQNAKWFVIGVAAGAAAKSLWALTFNGR